MNAALKIVLWLSLAVLTAVPSRAADGTREPAQVQVILREWEIVMPDRLAAGKVVFHVINQGTAIHSLIIAGHGDIFQLPRLKTYESARLEADLVPGEYSVYCPVDNHKMHGMELTIKVE